MKKDSKGFLEFVYEIYKTMKAHEISLVYEGEITHQITKAFTSLTESNMAREEESGTVQRRVFHVMVECWRILVNTLKILVQTIFCILAEEFSWLVKVKQNIQ